MKISVIQCNQKVLYDVSNPGKFNLETCKRLSEEVLEQNFKLIEDAAKEGVDLIVTMEAINVSIFPNDLRYNFADSVESIDGDLFKRFQKLSKQYGVYIVGGLYNKRNGKVYNSGILFGQTGNIDGIYDKVHLAGGEKVGLTAGDTYPVFKTKFGNIGILVCWDMQFPEAARELVLGGADLIVCPTWGWENIYGLSRAYENDVYIAAAMGIPPSGLIEGIRSPSCIVSGEGEIISSAARNDAGFVMAEVDIRMHTMETDGKSQREIRLKDRRPDTYILSK